MERIPVIAPDSLDGNSSPLSLEDVYRNSSEVLTFLETSMTSFNHHGNITLENWDSILHSHMEEVFHADQFLKIKTLGEGLDWLNTCEPLTLDESLRDKIIILHFFTFCCINCEHALPYLKEVEELFEENPELVIIGVHSPKFPNEKNTESVNNALLRYKITHPVINDRENSLWNQLGVYCWPTVLILSPDHRVLFSLVGEKHIEKLSHLCNLTINYFKTHKTFLNKCQLDLKKTDETDSSNDILKYPGGISSQGTSIIVSDSGHNRLLLMSTDGAVVEIIGSGVSGNSDGLFESSSFDSPHGTTWWEENFIFVADTGNHAIRMIDLESKSVSTIFSAHILATESSGNWEHRFASPWDVCIGPQYKSDLSVLNVLYIAVAGSHQIWEIHLDKSIHGSSQYLSLECSPFAGNGKEECRNNSYKMNAGFAQPSGICYSKLFPQMLFIADSESSTVRSISLVDGAVKTVVGGVVDPMNLFAFGDKEGIFRDVKLQHPIGICVMEREGCTKICITDTYNHKIKLIDPERRECVTVAGSGNRGSHCKMPVLESEFDEPSAICYSSLRDGFFFADTNNHCIKFFNPEMKKMELVAVSFPGYSNNAISTCENFPNAIISEPNTFTNIKIAYGGKINCTFNLCNIGVSLTDGNLQPWNVSLTGDCNWRVWTNSASLFDPSQQPSLILESTVNDTQSRYSEVMISSDVMLCDNIRNTCFCKKI